MNHRVKLSLLCLFVSLTGYAAHTRSLSQTSISALKAFDIKGEQHVQGGRKLYQERASTAEGNTLQPKNKSFDGKNLLTRYQQYYKGLPVIGGHVIIQQPSKQSGFLTDKDTVVNGSIIEDLEIEVIPTISSDEAVALARSVIETHKSDIQLRDYHSQLQIRMDENNQATLVYQVTLNMSIEGKPYRPVFIVDAHSAKVQHAWNNIKHFQDTGPGGNLKVHEYWYGTGGLPYLNVTQQGSHCQMKNDQVILVNLHGEQDYFDDISGYLYSQPYRYVCGQNGEDYVNGGFSPMNDAYYFGSVIVNMYQDWYQQPALQRRDGSPMTLMMRVHFGMGYDNAFWDGHSMSFGDGQALYPLVSLDVAGHEVSHGFTEQHSDLEYHDQPGALNESFSDMASVAVRQYLLESEPEMYKAAHSGQSKVRWTIGETISKSTTGAGRAMRYFDAPSKDGESADCASKQLAARAGQQCKISYRDVVLKARKMSPFPPDQQGYIVHTASGVFNKAFYLLSKKFGVKKAFQLMMHANIHHWQPSSNFTGAACGVVQSGRDLDMDLQSIRKAFAGVGISTKDC